MIDVLLIILFAVLPAIVLHEYAHGWAAYRLGDTTAKRMGRLTLNPIKHIDPVGSILIPGAFYLMYYVGMTKSLMLFGWAKPVPVNFSALRNPRLGIILVAIAGPLVNVILAFLLSKLYIWPALSSMSFVFGWAVIFNLTLAVFNMMPIPPLDGSRIVMGLLPPKLAYQYSRLEPFGFIIVIVLLQLGMLRFLYPSISLLGTWIGVQL